MTYNPDILKAPKGEYIELTYDGVTFVNGINHGGEDLISEWYGEDKRYLGRPVGWRAIKES